MQYAHYKFSQEYPAKFYKPGHNLPMTVFLHTINFPDSIEISNSGPRPNRLVYKASDGHCHEYVVVVSAGTVSVLPYACIVSGYMR